MSILNLLILLLFCNFCCAEPFNVTSSDTIAMKEENIIKITDLSFDIQFLIFSGFKLKDLYKIADAHPNFRAVTADLFRRRYSHLTMDIRETHSIFAELLFEREELETGKIVFRQIKSALKVLKCFGCVIQKINIVNRQIKANESNIISKIINKYGSESLIHLDFGEIKENTFEQFMKPMSKVENLTMTIDKVTKIKIGNLTLNQIFPKLRRLELELNADVDYSFLNYKFPHLEDLEVAVSGASWKQRDPIEGLLKHNPQIRSIRTFFVPRDYPKVINKWLPNLESASFQLFDIGNDTVRMEKLKKISIQAVESIQNLFLPSVEIIFMKYLPYDFDKWVTFFKNHQSVKKLHLSAERYLNMNFQFIELLENLPELNELNVEGFGEVGKEFGVEAITNVLLNHERLTMFRFSIYMYSRDEITTIFERFQHEWNIDQITVNHHYSKYPMASILMRKK